MTVIDWLLDSDPAIRWQVMRDLTHESDDVVATERARVAHEGWGARLLALQADDGQWAGGAVFPADFTGEGPQPWTGTYPTLLELVSFGVVPTDDRVSKAIAGVREGSTWEYDGSRFFDGEVEPCINGGAVRIGAYFGEDVTAIVERLLSEQLEDGGWNCEAENGSTRGSFDTTICVLEGLLEYERAVGGSAAIASVRDRAHEYLLERRLMYRLSDGEVPNEHWLEFAFPPRWHYDVLRALDYLRAASVGHDERMTPALDLIDSKRGADGRWLLENTHRGRVHFVLEDGDGAPSRWNTLRALRVLEHYRPV